MHCARRIPEKTTAIISTDAHHGNHRTVEKEGIEMVKKNQLIMFECSKRLLGAS